MTKEQIAKLIKEKTALALALLQKSDCSEDEKKQAETLLSEAEGLKAKHDEMERAEKLLGWVKESPAPAPAPAMPEREEKANDNPTVKTVHALPRYARVKHFHDYNDGIRPEQKAHDFGHFILAALCTRPKSILYCQEHGIDLKAMSEGVNTAGGFLVPDQFSNDLIDLREQYGVFRRNAKIAPMTRDVMRIPRRTSGVTGYWVGEAGSITASDKAWDMVNLVAKKLAGIAVYSSELGEDAIVSVGDDLANELAFAFAYQEDLAGFLGDGTSTYGGCMGLDPAFKKTVTDAGGTWTTDAHKLYNPSIMTATGNTMAEVTMADIAKWMGCILSTTNNSRCKFYCHRVFAYGVLVRLLAAQGGASWTETVSGAGDNLRFLGYPVVETQVMPSSDSNSQILAYFGDLAAAATFGDRREITISQSSEYKWDTDQLAVKATERIDISVHDVGTANSSAASRVMAPIAALAAINS